MNKIENILKVIETGTIIDTMIKVSRERYARKFLNKQKKMTKEQKEQAMKILVDFQKFIDKEEVKLNKTQD